MNGLRLRMCVCVALVAGLLAGRSMAETAFWVWNRSAPLSSEERAGLAKAGVTRLYWHFGEIENKTGTWAWKRSPKVVEKSTAQLEIVPVIRLETAHAQPFSSAANEVLLQELKRAFVLAEAREWQLDYDAPDRLVGDYASFLAQLRPQAPKLSSTALAGWIRLPAFGSLQQAVAELCPMFYDLMPDTADALRPLLDERITTPLLAEWQTKCIIPWRVGLPWFSRLTVYGKDGHSLGHFRRWTWDDVIFRRELSLAQPTREGLTVLRVTKSFALGRSPLHEGEKLVARLPDVKAITQVEQSLHRDAVYFRLPDGSAADGGSLASFIERTSSKGPRLALKVEGDRLVLTNEGDADLLQRWVGDGPMDRGYALEIDARGPCFREAEPGHFWRVAAHVQPDEPLPRAVSVTSATRLTFWFGALPAGASLRSGVFQTTLRGGTSGLRYRVLNIESSLPWKSLTVPH